MAYVTVGLLGVFGAFIFLGMRAVRRGTQLVYEERLAITSSVAAELGLEIEHIVPDIEEQVGRLDPNADPAQRDAALNDALIHLTTRDNFVFFSVESIELLDRSGGALDAVPKSMTVSMLPSVPAMEPTDTESRIVWPEDPAGSEPFLSVVVPLVDESGAVWARVVVNTRGRNTRENFVPFGPWTSGASESDVPAISEYHMEVLTPTGEVVLAAGPEETVGSQSAHYEAIRNWMAAGEGATTLHTASGTNDGEPHVIAAAPVPSSPLYLVLEQDGDVALALPTEFREQVLRFSIVGFLAVLAVAWLTTRRVVRPTQLLTAAAERMASGQLETAIEVDAQDEIGVLAEQLEVMRQQLKGALNEVESANHELESRVRDRTEQLRRLVHRALIAQEEERRRVSLELHDETAQALAALSMELDRIQRHASGLGADEAADLRDAQQMARDTLEGVRRTIQALGPAALERHGVAAALRSYADEFLGHAEIAVQVDAAGARAQLPEDVELALYRIGQEALNNAAGHANATRVEVALVSDEERAVLTVTDDGAGFDPDAATGVAGTRGLGIAGMRERALLVGGTFGITSRPGLGTTVRVDVPLRRG